MGPRVTAVRAPLIARITAAIRVELCLLAAVALVTWSWLRPAFNWSATGDGPNHLLRVYVVSAALDRGDWYPRWLPDLYLGYGYPLLNFYAPATYYVAAGLHRLGMTVYGALSWTGLLGPLLAVTGAYRLAHALGGGRRDAALLAAVSYLLAPYPFFVNLNGRAAVPEVLALGLLPWFLLAGWRTWHGGRVWSLVSALLTAVLVLTHNISAMIALVTLGIWLGSLTMAQLLRRASLRAIVPPALRTVAALALGIGLSCFFWLPALAELNHVQIERTRGGIFDPLPWLFTLEDVGKLAPTETGTEPSPAREPRPLAGLHTLLARVAVGKPVPERVGIVQVLLCLVAAAMALRPSHVLSGGLPALGWATLALSCWLLNGRWAAGLWERGVPLAIVQFPWRLYGPLALFIGLAASASLASFPPRKMGTRALHACAVLLMAALAYGTLAARPFPPVEPPAHDVDGRDLLAGESDHFAAGTTSWGEFLPRTVGWEDSRGNARGVRLYDRAWSEAGWQAGLVRVLEGPAAVTAINRGPMWIEAQTEAEAPSLVAFHQLFFPGWRAFLDGRPVPLSPVPHHNRLRASLGFMVVDVPAGSHRVEVRFGPTSARLLGGAVSAGALAVLAATAFTFWRYSHPGASVATASASRRRRLHLTTAATVTVLAAVTVGGMALGSLPHGTLPIGAARIPLDVITVLGGDTAETRAPSGTGRGLLPPFLELRRLRIGDDARRWLYMHPPTQVSVRVRVPRAAYLQAGLALDPQTWTREVGDGVRFVVEATGSGGQVMLFDRHVNPRAREEDRGWVDVWVSLDSVAGEEVWLTLRTEAAQETSFDWAGWGNPQIVVWNEARPHPGTQRRW